MTLNAAGQGTKMSQFSQLGLQDTGTYFVVLEHSGSGWTNYVYKGTGLLFKKDSTWYVTPSALNLTVATLIDSQAVPIADSGTIYATPANVNTAVTGKVNVGDSGTKYATPASVNTATGGKVNVADSNSKYATPAYVNSHTGSTPGLGQVAAVSDTSILPLYAGSPARGNYGKIDTASGGVYSGLGLSYTFNPSGFSLLKTGGNSISAYQNYSGLLSYTNLPLWSFGDGTYTGTFYLPRAKLTANHYYMLPNRDGKLVVADTTTGRLNLSYAASPLYLDDTAGGGGYNPYMATTADLNTAIGGLSTSYWKNGGNSFGAQGIIGTIDNNAFKLMQFNRVVDSVGGWKHYFMGDTAATSVGEVIASFGNTYHGAFQSNQVILGVGKGNLASSNVPFVELGSAVYSSGGLSGLSSYTLFQNSSTPTTIYGATSNTTGTRVGMAVAPGNFHAGGNIANTSGLFSFFSNGGNVHVYRPSGNGRVNIYDAQFIANDTGTANGVLASYTDYSATLTTVSGIYAAFEATKSTGYSLYASGGALFYNQGRALFGTGTDDGNQVQISGNLKLENAGNKILIATGTNSIQNTGTLSGGTVTISNTSVTASSHITLTPTSNSNLGQWYISSRVAGTSFTVTSTNASDASSFTYLIVN